MDVSQKHHKNWLKVKGFVLLGLCVMILMRLIWIQLREFTIIVEPRVQYWVEQTLAEDPSCQSDLSNTLHIDMNTYHGPKSPAPPLFSLYLQQACRGGVFSPGIFLRYNLNMMILVCFICVLLSRMIMGGWVMPVAICVVLLSRGRFLGGTGELSPLMLISVFLAIYYLILTHFVRTGWLWGIGVLAVLAYLCGLVMPVLWSLAIALPFIFLLLRLTMTGGLPSDQDSGRVADSKTGVYRYLSKARQSLGLNRYSMFDQEMQFERARLLSPLHMPLSRWLLFDKRWIKYLLVSLLCGCLVMGAVWLQFYLGFSTKLDWIALRGHQEEFSPIWIQTLFSQIDGDLWVSMIVVVLGGVSSRSRSIPSFPDLCVVFCVTFLAILAASYFMDLTEWSQARQQFPAVSSLLPGALALRLPLWFEPLLLTMGFMGLFNLIKIIDTYIPAVLPERHLPSKFVGSVNQSRKP